jgi:hypothetical protein
VPRRLDDSLRSNKGFRDKYDTDDNNAKADDCKVDL